MRKAVVVLSGGQDSTTCLFWAIDRFGKDNVCAIGFDYGQRHKLELECAEEICRDAGIDYEVIPTPIINQLSANSLTRDDIPVEETKPEGGVPNTFVEGRNHLFLSYAAIYAKTHGATDLVTGVCETDFFGLSRLPRYIYKIAQRDIKPRYGLQFCDPYAAYVDNKGTDLGNGG